MLSRSSEKVVCDRTDNWEGEDPLDPRTITGGVRGGAAPGWGWCTTTTGAACCAFVLAWGRVAASADVKAGTQASMKSESMNLLPRGEFRDGLAGMTGTDADTGCASSIADARNTRFK